MSKKYYQVLETGEELVLNTKTPNIKRSNTIVLYSNSFICWRSGSAVFYVAQLYDLSLELVSIYDLKLLR